MKPVTDALLPSSSSSFCSAAAVANNPLRHRPSTPPPPFAIAAVRRPTTPCSSSRHCRLSGPLLLIVGLLLLAQSLKATDPFQTQNEWEEHRICGRLLINALKTVCNHQYAQPTREQLYDNYYKNPGMVFRARRGSASIAPLLGGGSARRRRGIIWECCTNKCSLNYIRNNYCAQGPTGEGGLGAAAWQLVDERR